MTLREQMEAALQRAPLGNPVSAVAIDALLPVVEAAVAAERERCARIAHYAKLNIDGMEFVHWNDACEQIAAAIRAA